MAETVFREKCNVEFTRQAANFCIEWNRIQIECKSKIPLPWTASCPLFLGTKKSTNKANKCKTRVTLDKVNNVRFLYRSFYQYNSIRLHLARFEPN